MAEQRPLHIGDTVLFMVKLKEHHVGYISSELSSSSYNFLTVKPAQSVANSGPCFTDVSCVTFKIIAPKKSTKKNNFNQVSNSKTKQKKQDTKVFYGDSIQLQHVGSKKFIQVCSEASQTESNNLLLALSADDSKGCTFRLLPRYKVRSEGDEIRFGDQLKIESTKTQGQYLHCSKATFEKTRFSLLTECYELNLSAAESSITLLPHYCPSQSHPIDGVRGGKCVRLFHKEDECYMVAEGSFAEANPVIEDVHCRMRRIDVKKQARLPSTSSYTYWQIEKQVDSRRGDIISWGERIRLKHLPTKRYLAVIKDKEKWKVTLQERSEERDVDTIFSLFPLIEEGEQVLYESYAHIKHLYSKQWLHLEKKNVYVKKKSVTETGGLAGLEWDSAALFVLTTSRDKGDYDSFTLQEVTEGLIDKFNYVAGIVPILESYNRKVRLGETIKREDSVCIRDTLMELCGWIVTDCERDTKDNQKLLRNLRVLEQLREILATGNEAFEKSEYHIIEMCRECYNVIKKFLEGDSRKNENYIARFIEFFQTQVRKGLNAEEVLVEIVQDNLTIVSTMADTQMDKMIERFLETEDPKFLDFLSSLCVCSGRPIPSTQSEIIPVFTIFHVISSARLLNELVLTKGKDAFLKTEIREVENNIERVFIFDPKDKYNTPISIRDITTSMKGRNLFELLESQLHLFARLCRGNNKTSIDALVSESSEYPNIFVSFDEVFLCVQDNQIHTAIRVHYIELLLVMFVDVGDNKPFMDHLCYSFIFDDLSHMPYADTGDDRTIALTGSENLYFPRLKVWILDTLERNCVIHCTSEFIDENKLLVKIIDVLGHLVRFGYYDDISDVNDVIIRLIKLLDGSTDIPCQAVKNSKTALDEFKKNGRKLDCKENRPVFEMKCKVLEVLKLLFRFKFYVKLQKFIHDFKILFESSMSEREEDDNSIFELLPLLDADHNHPQDWLFSSRMIHIVHDRMKYLCDGNAKDFGFAPDVHSLPSLDHVLLDMSSYECDELVTSSLDLLNQLYFFEEELFNKAQQSQLLTSNESLVDYRHVNNTILPELRQLLRVDANRDDQDKIIELLDRLSGMCLLSFSAGVGIKTNKHNQIMLDNFGLVSEIVTYVLAQGSHEQSTIGSSVAVCGDVFKECFSFLHHIAADNPTVQTRLFNRFDDIFEIKFPTVSLSSLADLMAEVFTGGPELILKVTESQIETIFDMIYHCNDINIQARLMMALETLAKIEDFDLPVSRNQHLIIKNFCRLRDSICQEFLGQTAEMEQKRMKILKGSDSDDSPLQLLLGVVNMLAACAVGKDRFIDSVCQNILSIEEVVNIISTDLLPQRKKPFVRFLIFAYLITDDDHPLSQLTALTHGVTMWRYLEHLALILEGVANVLDSLPKRMIDKIRNGLSSKRQASVYMPNRNVKRNKQRLNELRAQKIISVKAVSGVTDDKGELYPDMMEYLAEGVIPLLHSYYSSYFNPSTLAKESDRIKEFNISANITKGLMHLSQDLVKVFSSKKHIKMYQETLSTLLSYDYICETASIDNQQIRKVQRALELAAKRASYGGTLGPSFDGNDNMAGVIEDYNNQKNLNDLFNNYSRNYHICYMGPNTAKHQINSPVTDTIAYSDEGEELPLGPSFQHLVNLYVDQDTIIKDHTEGLLRQLEISCNRKEQLGEEEQILQDILDIRCLQTLRALVHNRIKLIDPELKDRDALEFRQKSDALIVPVQNRIQDLCNTIHRIIPFLSHHNELISHEALALMKVLLFSGNAKVQEALIVSVRETREETLFLNLKHRLEVTGNTYIETMDIRSQLLERKQAQIDKDKEVLAAQLAYDSLVNEDSLNNNSNNHSLEPVVEYNNRQVSIALDAMHETNGTDDLPLTIQYSPSIITLRRRATFTEIKPLKNNEDDFSDEHTLLTQLMAKCNCSKLVFEVIGFMCDGQHRTLQHYLRKQPDNFKSVNVIAEVINLLHIYTGDLTQDSNLGQTYQILRSLIEMCVGNADNRQVIFDKLVVDPLNKIFQLSLADVHKECHYEETATDKCPVCIRLLDIINMKGSAAELLEVMLENTSHDTKTIAKGIGLSLDVESVLETMQLFYELQFHPLVKKNQTDDDCVRGMFRSYHTVVSLMDFEAISSINDTNDLLKKVEELKCRDSYNASIKGSHCIEIHYKGEETRPVLAKVYFPYDHHALLREEVSELVRWSVNRDSLEDKQRSLLDAMPALKKDVRHQSLLKGTKILYPFVAFHTWRARLLLFLTVLLNIFVLASFRQPPKILTMTNATSNYSALQPTADSWYRDYALYIFGSFHLVMSVWVVMEYFLINFPHFRLPLFVNKIYKVKFLVNFLKRKGWHRALPNVTCLGVNIFGISSLYMILMVMCSILSLVFSGYFYSVCLLFVIFDNDILKRVLKAVTKNGMALIWVGILGIIVLFIYAIIAFSFLHTEITTGTSSDFHLYCQSLFQCMYTVLRYGLIDNLGLIIPISPTFNGVPFVLRLLFDLSFFIIVTTIGLNIVFGIIVDSFGELREERSNTEADQRNNCFICNLPSYEFERHAKGFLHHIKYNHNMWDYIYYSLYIDSIDTGDHNAIQKYVYELILNNDTGFFPQEEAMCLEGDDDATSEKIEELQATVDKILQHFQNKEHAKNVRAKRQEQMKWEEEICSKPSIQYPMSPLRVQ